MTELDTTRDYEAEYEMYKLEWKKAMDCGKHIFDTIIKPYASNVVDEETWLNGFVQGWMSKKT